MIVDTSAIIAVLQREACADRLVKSISDTDVRRISAAAVVEASIVAFARFGDPGDRELDLLIHRMQLDIIPVAREQVDLARSAYRRFGKGHHAAALNFGDCFSYALAVSLGEPLLFTGKDFTQTDVEIAAY